MDIFEVENEQSLLRILGVAKGPDPTVRMVIEETFDETTLLHVERDHAEGEAGVTRIIESTDQRINDGLRLNGVSARSSMVKLAIHTVIAQSATIPQTLWRWKRSQTTFVVMVVREGDE